MYNKDNDWKKYKLNWYPSKKSPEDIKFRNLFPKVKVIPQQVDLRVKYGDIFDQGELGSCTSNSVAGCLKMVEKCDPKITPSRLFIYYNGQYTTYRSIDKRNWPLLIEEIVSSNIRPCVARNSS